MTAPSRTALVTGASSDLGQAIARTLATDGWSLVLTGRDSARGDPLAEELDARWIAGDLTDPTFVEELGGAERFGGFVHAASHRFRYQRFHLADAEDAQKERALDHDAPLALLTRILPEMMALRSGRVVLVTSLAADVGSAGGAHYAVNKAGLQALARTLALEYGRFGITVNAVQPGFIATSRLDERLGEGRLDARGLADRTALKRLAEPSEVARVVAFLMGPAASYVTGITLPVTGGLHLNTLW